jgi:hypothetical protein
MRQPLYTQQTIIFSGGLWSQQSHWQKLTYLLPKNACLLVVDTQNKKQTQVMREIARSFQDKGRQVLIWMPPNQAKNFEEQ